MIKPRISQRGGVGVSGEGGSSPLHLRLRWRFGGRAATLIISSSSSFAPPYRLSVVVVLRVACDRDEGRKKNCLLGDWLLPRVWCWRQFSGEEGMVANRFLVHFHSYRYYFKLANWVSSFHLLGKEKKASLELPWCWIWNPDKHGA